MRRNMGRRGNNSSGGGGGGPLMTGHLQDIDLELELLKRKREMIEQQQQLLVMEQQYKSRHSFDQMRYDEPDSNRDFTHLYETGPRNRGQFGRKRPAENQWQYDSAPKRTPQQKKKSQFNQQGSGNPVSGNFRNQRPYQGQGSKSAPIQPAPLMDIKVKPSIGQKIANQKAQPKAPRKDFAPSKVAKPKAPPNKLASHTVTERKSLVAAATAASSDGDMSRMLLPDRVPSQQVSGRLELALGAIMKNIKGLIDAKHPHATVLRSMQMQRVMKQAVRERIRTVMLGKVVGSLIEILAIYREEFPEETDADVMNIALEAGGLSAPEKPKFIESGQAGEFFKINMNKLLDITLNEMFSKLEDIYSNAPAIDPAAIQQIDLQKNPDEKGKETQNEHKVFLATTLKVYDVKRILPRLMKKYVPYVIKLLHLDGMYQSTKEAITMKANEKAAKTFGTTGEEGQGDGQSTAPTLQTTNENRYNLPYYVKIMGKPTMPKKKVMQGFLSQFNPKSIKKHRSIHNLLFIGFSEKSDFDVMVAADGTVVGRSTLSVRVCSKGGPQESNGEASVSNDATQEAIKQENEEEGQIIPSDLDGQITDLLSAIRRSEEEDLKKENVDETENNGGEETSEDVNEQTENNSDQVKESESDVKNDEQINENTGNEENIDEILDENTASQEKDASNEVETQDSEAANESEAQNTEANDELKTENSEVPNGEEKPEPIEISDDSNKDENSQEGEIQMDTDKASETTESTKTDEQSDDKVADLKSSTTGRSTPSRMSARLANVTPSTIRTRRASRLTSQN